MPAQTLSLSFPGARGTMLAARLDLPPAAAPLAYALFAHCFTCSKETKATTYVSAALAERDGEAEVDIGGRPFRIRRQFLEDIAGSKLGDEVANMGKALLVMHSPRDSVVGVDNATRIFSAARHPRSFISLDPADHMLSRREDALYAGNILASWAARYLPASADTSPAPVPGTVLVEETREGKFSQRVVAGRHVIRADEPLAAGGMDSGLSPYDLVLAGLGACTSMTIRMYADLKGFPLERATVELRHEKIHAADCADCETREGKVDRIDRLIRLEGPLSEEQRAKLLEISNKCPVHRTLHSEVNIPTRLAD